MGVQKEILRRTFTGDVQRYEVTKDAEGKPISVLKTVQYTAGSAALVGGTPGQIYDVAYGPVAHTTNLPEAADIGSFVKGRGIIINAPEYALYGTLPSGKDGGPLAPSLTLPANTVVSVMTAGHVWVKRGELDAIKAGMNTYVIYEPEGDDENDLCVVEVNGLLPSGDDSTANG